MATTVHPFSNSHAPSAPAMEAPRVLNLQPILPVLWRTLNDINFIPVLKPILNCLDSNALWNATQASLKSIPYAYYGEHSAIAQFENGLTCRMRYFETALMATASLVYNFVASLLFSAATLVTFGRLTVVKDQAVKSWIQTALAIGSVAVGLVGTASPDLGIKLNGVVFAGIGVSLYYLLQADVLGRVCTVYQSNRTDIKGAFREGVGDDQFYNREFVPFFDYLDRNFTTQNVRSLEDFQRVVEGARQLYPNARLFPTIPQPFNNLSQVISQLARAAAQQS